MIGWFTVALALDLPVSQPVGPDRSAPPIVLPPTAVDLTEFTVVELKPGLRLLHSQVPNVRDIHLRIDIWDGWSSLDAEPHHVQLTSAVWGTATEAYSEQELSTMEDRYDLSISSRIGPDRAYASVEISKERAEMGWEVLEQVVMHPVFDKDVLKRVQEELNRFYLVNGPTTPGAVVSSARDFAWYEDDHPLALRPDIEVYNRTKVGILPPILEQVRSLGPVDIVFVGDLPLDAVEAQARKRFGGLGKPGERAQKQESKPPPPRVIAIPMADTEQISIAHRRVAPVFGSEDQVQMRVLAYAMGGHFLARFNRNLREDKGWTYSVRSWYGADKVEGSYNITVDVPADKMAPAVKELKKELQILVTDGVSAEEIDASWRSAMKSYNDTRSTTSESAEVYRDLNALEASMAERLAQIQARRAVTSEETQILAKTLFGEERGLWIFLGPREGLETGLKELGLTADWIEPRAALLGMFDGPTPR